MPPQPEEKARQRIDSALAEAGGTVQDYASVNLSAARAVAVREFRLAPGHGNADYLLFIDARVAVGVLEATKDGKGACS